MTIVAHVRATASGRSRVEGLDVPTTLEIDFEGVAFPLDGSMKATLTGGRYVVESITCRRQDDGPTITTDVLRSVPVATLVRTAVMVAVEVDGPLLEMASEELMREMSDGPTEENLKRIARTYRLAYLAGEAPTAAVAGIYGLPRSTAGRWVRLARKRGLLGPTRERVAGPGDES